MLAVHHLRDLLLDPGRHPRGQPHLSAASGLVRVHRHLYVVADDEHHLAVFEESDPASPIALLRLFDGESPLDKTQRKAAKPDLESLALLPAIPGCPHGALLAFGSGSRPTRQTGVLVPLDAKGMAKQRVARIDLSGLYAPLKARFADLNVEGAFVAGGELHLLQRGNKGDARNARITFDWNQVAQWLAGAHPNTPAIQRIQEVELGSIDGVPLGLTDGAALPGGAWVFCAAAENTVDSYQDGACAGSAIGIVAPDGALRQMEWLQGAPKVEGIAVRIRGSELALTLVTDADDPDCASRVLQATWQMPQCPVG